MLKFIKFIMGVLFLPMVYAVTATFVQQMQERADWSHLELTTWWFIGGFSVWVMLYFFLPRPIRTYVLAHELTHALWGFVMGAKVSKLHVSSKGGSVTLTKTNTLITLAPYFFPFYTVLMLIAYCAINLWWDTNVYRPFWFALFGLTWAFHLTFTLSMLALHQPDILEHGRLFSYVVIYCINLATAAFLVNLLTERNLTEVSPMLSQHVTESYRTSWKYVQPLIGRVMALW
jgi:hypothetical protein